MNSLQPKGFQTEFFNVLIIEDSSDDALLLVRFLTKNQFQFTHKIVDTFQDFQTELENQTWDLVLSDYSLQLVRFVLSL